MKINTTSVGVNSYLLPLKHVAHPISRIYYQGMIPAQRITSVAIVGSRKPTSYGKQVTYDIAYSLARRGIVVISGLAFGVDAIAHRAALDAGGITIAVLPGGLDSVYPASHRRLAHDILEMGGALVSEYPEGTSAHKHHFLARNRIVSGLADAVIVTEAGERSGTLSTVNHALDQNKEIFAVPGNITSLLSVGPNRLIEQGAHPLLSVESVLDVIAPNTKLPLRLDLSPQEKELLTLIKKGVGNEDQLQTLTKMPTDEFLYTLSLLEIQGDIVSSSSRQWKLR